MGLRPPAAAEFALNLGKRESPSRSSNGFRLRITGHTETTLCEIDDRES